MPPSNTMARPAPRPAAAPPPRAPRVTLASIVHQAKKAPLRVLVHGVEGVGKTTFAAGAPAPIILGPEDGIPRALGDVPHFPHPEGGWTWADAIDAVRALATGEHGFRTLVVDTLDWLEPLLWAFVCERAGVNSIEEVGGGYGKGYTEALTAWRGFIAELEQLRRAKGMHLVLLAHTVIRTFKNPVGEDFDRYEMKLNAKAAGLWKEWPDAVLFACHDDVASKDKRTKRVRGVSTGARVLRTVHHAAYDAKNRFDLAEELPLDWQDFEAAVEGKGPAGGEERVAELRASIEAQLEDLTEENQEQARAAIERAGDDINKLARLDNWVAARAQQKGA